VVASPDVHSEISPSSATLNNRVYPKRTEGNPDSGYAEGVVSIPSPTLLLHGTSDVV